MWWSVALPQVRCWWGPSHFVPGLVATAVMMISVMSLRTLFTAAADAGLGDYDGQRWRQSPTLAAVRHISDPDPPGQQ